ncbi:unnamed protein product, partial [Larinioides sclopetarius]
MKKEKKRMKKTRGNCLFLSTIKSELLLVMRTFEAIAARTRSETPNLSLITEVEGRPSRICKDL